MQPLTCSAVFALLLLQLHPAFATASVTPCGTCTDACELRPGSPATGSTDAQPISAVDCRYPFNPPGSWYLVVGTGQTLQVDTCDHRNNFDGALMVFYSCNLTNAVYRDCVGFDEDGCSQRRTRLTFFAALGKPYFVFVTGQPKHVGVYYLSATAADTQTHDTCSDAILVSQLPYITRGNTISSTAVSDSCLGDSSGGLWYSVRGNGMVFVAHTCSFNTDFDTSIEVYLDCSEDEPMQCLTYNDDDCYTQSRVMWRSVMDQQYWIFVTGFADARGTFSLVIENAPLIPHAECTDPQEITTLPFVYSGTTARLSDKFSECNHQRFNGMWFRMKGIGRTVLISTCSHEGNKNGGSEVEVYTFCNEASREAEECVEANKDYCGTNAAVILDAQAPVYYIWVHGHALDVGTNFTLTVAPYERQYNSHCVQATEIALPSSFHGTTLNVPKCVAGCDGVGSERYGAWFEYVHHGERSSVVATTCNRYNVLKARLEVYNDCNVMECNAQASYDAKKDCTAVIFPVEDGKTYSVLLTGDQQEAVGNYYMIDFYEQKRIEQSKCNAPYVVPKDGLPFRVQQNTWTALPSWSACRMTLRSGYWVKVVGDGNKYVASTCDANTDYETLIEVFDRCPEEGTAQGCVDYSVHHSTCGLGSTVEWVTTNDAEYWIFVTGELPDQVGNSVLTISSKASPSNAKCLHAKRIKSFPHSEFGLTTFAAPSNGSCVSGSRKGLWYTFYGIGQSITIETCGIESTIETQVEIYMDCTDASGGAICIAHSHGKKCAPQTSIEVYTDRTTLYWLFVTGVYSDVRPEGFFNLRITPTETPTHSSGSLPHVSSSGSLPPGDSSSSSSMPPGTSSSRISSMPPGDSSSSSSSSMPHGASSSDSPLYVSSSGKAPHKRRWVKVVGAIFGVMVGLGVFGGVAAVAFYLYQKRRRGYVGIPDRSSRAPVQ